MKKDKAEKWVQAKVADLKQAHAEAFDRWLADSAHLQDRAEAAEAEVERLRAENEAASDRTSRLAGRLHDANNAARDLLAQIDTLRAEIRDRESERADLRDRVQKAEAQVARVEEVRRELEVDAVHGFSDVRAEAREFLRRLRPALEDPS